MKLKDGEMEGKSRKEELIWEGHGEIAEGMMERDRGRVIGCGCK
jgi:hypothetical protein